MENILKQQTEHLRAQTKFLEDIEGHARVDKAMQAVQAFTAYKNLKDSDNLVKGIETLSKMTQTGLIEKDGDGLNANVIKLAEEIRNLVKVVQKQSSANTPYPTPVNKERSSATPAGSRGEVDPMKVQEKPRTFKDGLKSSIENVRKKFTLEDMFQVEGEGKGIIGSLITGAKTRKENVAQREQYITDQMAVNPRIGNLKQFRGEDGKPDQEKIKDYYGKRFDNVQDVKRRTQETEQTISSLRKRGATDKDISRGGYTKQLSLLDEEMARVDPRYARSKVDQIQPRVAGDLGYPQTATPATAAATPAATPAAATPATAATLVPTGAEKEIAAENLRLMEDQNETIKQIEENTRPLAQLGDSIKKLGEEIKSQPKGGGEGGGGSSLIGAITDLLGMGGKGGAAAGAGSVLKRTAGALLKRAPLIGTALAVGAGGYAAYQGFTSASKEEEEKLREVDQRVAAGQMTKEEGDAIKREAVDKADVKQSASVGGGVGLAAGAIGGAKAGAMLGTLLGPVGTVVGGAAGAAVGAIAGSAAGKDVGRWGAKAWQGVRGVFGGQATVPEGPSAAKPDEKAPVVTKGTTKATGNSSGNLNINGTAVSYGQKGGKFLINEKEVDEATYKQFITAKDNYMSPENSPEYKKIYEEELQKEIGERTKSSFGYRESDAPMAEAQARSTAQDRVHAIHLPILSAAVDKANAEGKPSAAEPQGKEGGVSGNAVSPVEGAAKAQQAEAKSKDDVKPGLGSRIASAVMKAVPVVGLASIAMKAGAGVFGRRPGTSTTSEVMPADPLNKNAIVPRTPSMLAPEARSKANTLEEAATKLGLNPNEAKGTFEGGTLTSIKDTATGKVYPIDVRPEDQQKVNALRSLQDLNGNSGRPEQATAVPLPVQSADAVYQQSSENTAAATRSSVVPSTNVVNAPTNNIVNNSNYAAPKKARNPESSYQQYNRSKYAY